MATDVAAGKYAHEGVFNVKTASEWPLFFLADESGFALPPIAVGSLGGICRQGTGDHRLAALRVELSLDVSRRMPYLLSLIGFCGLASSLARH